MARTPKYDRDQVLERALRLFWSRGYQGTSLKDLEDALDMRPGSIYAAFGSKEKLFDESLQRYSARSRDAFEETLAASPSVIAGLANHVRNIGRAETASAPARACMLVKTVLETPDDDPVLRQRAEALMRDVEAGFARVFERAKEEGELPPESDPQRLASWLQIQIFGLRAYAQRSDASERLGDLVDDIAASVERLRQTA